MLVGTVQAMQWSTAGPGFTPQIQAE